MEGGITAGDKACSAGSLWSIYTPRSVFERPLLGTFWSVPALYWVDVAGPGYSKD